MSPWTTALLFAAGIAWCVRAAPAADPTPATAPDFAVSFPSIRRQLASGEYQQREAGQKELDKISVIQLEALRQFAAAEDDPEVKARLDGRIDALELYALIHPAPLFINYTNATLAEIAAGLNEQLGENIVDSRAGVGKFTLAADHLPFWEIISQLNRQSPLTVTGNVSTTFEGHRNRLSIQQIDTAPHTYILIDTFAVSLQIVGQPNVGNWSLRLAAFSDPRVRIAQYSQLRLVKITDQDGASLLPLVLTNSAAMANAPRPMIAWSSSATLNSSPTLTRIKELRAGIAISVIEKEQTITIDLTKPVAPINSARGRITVEQNPNANGIMRLNISSPSDGAANAAGTRILPLWVRVFDKNGTLAQDMSATGTQVIFALPQAKGPPSKVELSWPEKIRDIVLPVELKDLEIPVAAARFVQPAQPPIVRPLPPVVPAPAIQALPPR